MAFTDSIKWNGKSLRDYFAEITEVMGRGKPRVNVKGISIPGRHGQMAFKQTYKPRIIEIEGTVEGTSHSNLMSNIDNLKSLFAMEDELLPTGNRTISDGMEYGRLEFGDESGRYYNAVFDGIFDLPEISHRWMSNDIKRFRARFRCDEPFAVASALSEATMAGSADEFKTFPTGTAHNDSIIEIKGAVTNPILVEGDKAAIAHFDYSDNLSDVTLSDIAGNYTNQFGYRTFKNLSSRQSKGIQINRKDNLYFDRGSLLNGFNYKNFNPYQGTVVIWLKPYFTAGDLLGHTIFIEKFGSNNFISIEIDNQTTPGITFTYREPTATNSASISGVAGDIVAGAWVMITARWDLKNKIDSSNNSLQIDVNTSREGGNTKSTIAVGDVDATLSIGQDENLNASQITEGLIHWQILERALSDAEIAALYNSGAGVEPFVTPDTKLLSAGELSSGVPVSVQYPWVDNKFTDGDQEVDPAAEWVYGGTGGSGVNTSVTNEAAIVKYDAQSAQLDWTSALTEEYAFRSTVVLVDNQDYFYRLWVYAQTLHFNDRLFLDIAGNSTVHTRRLDNVTDDMGVSYATGKWLYFEGTFEADGAVAHQFRLRKVNANGDAEIRVDQMDCQVSNVDNGGMENFTAGLADSWTLMGTPTITEDNSTVHSGGASQKIVTDAIGEGIRQNGVSFPINKWFLAAVWLKGSDGTEDVIINVEGLVGAIGETSKTITNISTNWTKYYLLIKSGASDTNGDLRIRTAESGTNTFWIDDVHIIELDTVTANAASKATPEFDSYSQERFGQGLLLDGDDTLSWNVTANKDEGSIIVWLKPLFGSGWTGNNQDAVFYEIWYDANNYLRLFYDGTNGKFVFRKKVSGTDYDAELLAPTFNAGETLCLTGTYGAGGVKVYLNGIAGNVTNSNVSALSGNPATLYMSDGAQTLFPDAIVDELYLFSRELSGVEALKYANSATALKNDNAKFSMTKVLAEGDRLLLDSRKQTVEFADSSAGTFTNAVASMDVGAILPKLESGKSVIFNKTANGGMNIKYRKRWL